MSETALRQKNLVINKHTVFTVPNILVFIRILCIPIYMTLLVLGSRASEFNNYEFWWIYVALGIMAFAALTDVLDGKIARKYKAGTKIGKHTVKYDQGTYLGQVLDPIGDKAMHIGVLLALALAKSTTGSSYLHWAFLAFLVLRELCMVVIGAVLVNDINVKANMLGKVASAIISCSAIMCFFHAHFEKLWTGYTLDWIFMTIGIALNWAAAINYGVDAKKQLKNKKTEALEAPKTENETSEENATETHEKLITGEEEK